MITIIPIEPINDEHALLIIEAFNRHFINGGGKEDGDGSGFGSDPFSGEGWGSGCGYGNGDGGKYPEEWMIDESNQALTGGQNQKTLRDKKR
jgi:hypothetical protein